MLVSGTAELCKNESNNIFWSSNANISVDDKFYGLFDLSHRPNPTPQNFYAFITPFIIFIGLCGNVISFFVFTSTRLRKLSASLYLAALSASDSVVLLTYVLFDWLSRGLWRWPGGVSFDLINHTGLCHGFLLISYMFRFVSVYLIVVFTLERYIAVCMPLQRRVICTKSFARKVIASVYGAGIIVSSYKPLLSGMYTVKSSTSSFNKSSGIFEYLNISENSSESPPVVKVCRGNPLYEEELFVMELAYGILITAVPFLIVTVFNVVMLKQLINTQIIGGSFRALFKRRKIRVEFAIMVIAVSSSFVCLNVPYFVVWLRQSIQSSNPENTGDIRQNSEALRITRAIFSVNYCINFVVYCFTGTYYRSIMKRMFMCNARATSNYGSRHAVELSSKLIPNQSSSPKTTSKKDSTSKHSDLSDEAKNLV